MITVNYDLDNEKEKEAGEGPVIESLLAGIGDEALLLHYHEETLGPLERYDEDNGTEYAKFLRVYLECGGRPQKVGERLYIHRNTVTNYLKKIRSITGKDMTHLDCRVEAYLAYCVEDMLNEGSSEEALG